MARATGPKCRICRREGLKLFLKGDRCYNAKCAIERRQTVPGMHGDRRNRKQTDYAVQLREKQRLKRLYGLYEAPFRRFFALAERTAGNTGENLLRLLERRLDNVVMRMGFAPSHAAARELVAHGHIRVNGRRVNRASYLVRQSDEIVLAASVPRAVAEAYLKVARERGLPGWVEVMPEEMKGVVKTLPSKDDISVPVDVNLVVTYYSK